MFGCPRLDFVRVVSIPVAQQPPQISDGEHHPPVPLDLLQVFEFVADQALVVLVAGHDVSDAPETGPAVESE